MPARKPKPGGRYRYVGAIPLGVDAGQLLPGTVVTVREVVDADEIGAHDGNEDAVVIEWEAPGTVVVDMHEEPYQRPEVVVEPDGSIAVDTTTGAPLTVLVDRKRAVPEYGYGTILRAMSVGLDGRDYTDLNGRPAHFAPFSDLFAEEG